MKCSSPIPASCRTRRWRRSAARSRCRIRSSRRRGDSIRARSPIGSRRRRSYHRQLAVESTRCGRRSRGAGRDRERGTAGRQRRGLSAALVRLRAGVDARHVGSRDRHRRDVEVSRHDRTAHRVGDRASRGAQADRLPAHQYIATCASVFSQALADWCSMRRSGTRRGWRV